MTLQDATSPGFGTRTRGALLLADISGYTGFLQGIADAHYAMTIVSEEPPPAYSMVSSLIDRIVTELEPRFRLAKLEGDAVFATAADAADSIRGPEALDRLRACYAGFAERLGQATDIWSCQCDSCSLINGLDLKFVLHHGDAMVQRIAGREELLGPDVNLVHRLLKNHVHEQVGPGPYALITDAALEALGIPADGMTPITETYESIPVIGAHVLRLP